MVITTWETWLRDRPDTVVLDINTNFRSRRYTSPGQVLCFQSPPPYRLLSPTGYVFALQLDDQAKAYPTDLVGTKRVEHDTLGDIPLVIPAGAATRTARAYAPAKYTFSPSTDALVHSQFGQRPPRLGDHVSYWFGRYAFYPQTAGYAGLKPAE